MLYLLLVASEVLSRRDRDERGATAAEYALLVAFVVIVVYVGVEAFRVALDAFFVRQQSDVSTWAPN